MKRGQVLEISGSKAVVQVQSVLPENFPSCGLVRILFNCTRTTSQPATVPSKSELCQSRQVFEGTSGIDNKNTQVRCTAQSAENRHHTAVPSHLYLPLNAFTGRIHGRGAAYPRVGGHVGPHLQRQRQVPPTPPNDPAPVRYSPSPSSLSSRPQNASAGCLMCSKALIFPRRSSGV